MKPPMDVYRMEVLIFLNRSGHCSQIYHWIWMIFEFPDAWLVFFQSLPVDQSALKNKKLLAPELPAIGGSTALDQLVINFETPWKHGLLTQHANIFFPLTRHQNPPCKYISFSFSFSSSIEMVYPPKLVNILLLYPNNMTIIWSIIIIIYFNASFNNTYYRCSYNVPGFIRSVIADLHTNSKAVLEIKTLYWLECLIWTPAG